MNNVQLAMAIAQHTANIKLELAKQYGNKIFRATEEELYSYLDSCEINESIQASIDFLNNNKW